MGAEPWIYSASANKLETNDSNKSAVQWDLATSIAKDFSRWELGTEGHISKNKESNHQEIEEANLRIHYNHAISPYWDLQMGWQRDFRYSDIHDHTLHRDWLSAGIEGIIPWFIHSEFMLLVNDKGDSSVNIEFEKKLMLTQKWILQPELELQFYGQHNENFHQGSGLSESTFSVRLKYRAGLKFYPYIGGQWQRHHSNTANLLRQDNEPISDNSFVIGFHYWY